MKNSILRTIFFAIVLPLTSIPAVAQDNLDQFLGEHIQDSEAILTEYMSPFMKSVGLGINQGWYNTAKNHKTFGVDLTITVSGMTIPGDETMFNVENLNLQHIGLHTSSPDFPNAPTIFGSNNEEDTPMYYYIDEPDEEPFKGPLGIGLEEEFGKNVMPVPVANLGIGLPKGTDLKIRFVPTLSLGDDGEFNMWGVGVMHDIKQWIPGIKLVPFDLSGFVGYTKLSMTYTDPKVDQSVPGENQRSEFTMSSTTIQGVISKKFSVITFYGGIGYNIAKSNVAILGTYDLDDSGIAGDQSQETDPVSIDFSASGPRATAGFRLKLAVLTLHADYTFQKYAAFSAGIGISVH